MKKSAGRGKKAWSILRLALLRTRKGSVLRSSRVIMDLSKYLKKTLKTTISASSWGSRRSRNYIYYDYGERELSFDATPVIHVKMHRPASSLPFKVPCIVKPQVDDCDFDNNDDIVLAPTKSDDDCDYDDVEEELEYDYDFDYMEAGVDERAEEFIAKFYQQMRFCRDSPISYLE